MIQILKVVYVLFWKRCCCFDNKRHKVIHLKMWKSPSRKIHFDVNFSSDWIGFLKIISFWNYTNFSWLNSNFKTFQTFTNIECRKEIDKWNTWKLNMGQSALKPNKRNGYDGVLLLHHPLYDDQYDGDSDECYVQKYIHKDY